jgi:hypothetical protein
MAEIPKGVLSEQFQEFMKGRRLRSGVFLTFRFDPGFFEQEVLPVFLDVPLSHSPALRVVHLEDVLRSDVDHLAVYYDQKALEAGSQSAKLDVRRIPIAHRTGYFHPKNVLLLVEDGNADDTGYRMRHLIVAAMSANLTEAGWWKNVEVCHIEIVSEGEASGFQRDIRALIARVKRACPEGVDHSALEAIQEFTTRRIAQREYTKLNDVLYPRLYSGGKSVPEFLTEVLGDRAHGLNLEVISPYFDDTDAAPLTQLMELFEPREVRILLPRADDGTALCSEDYYSVVRKLSRTSWGQLPSALQRMGKAENSASRLVHAKVYRFFHPSRRYEALFIGSVNLTGAAHSIGGNFESAFLVETSPGRVPDWWLSTDVRKPIAFHPEADDETTSASSATALVVRYNWSEAGAGVFWNADHTSPSLALECSGVPLLDLPALPPRQWLALDAAGSALIAQQLASTSYFLVRSPGEEPATILVQEEGMSHKPSLLLSLSSADILRYWALLTPEQRAAFIDTKFGILLGVTDDGTGARLRPTPPDANSMFATFAGIFHAFGSLEKAVRAALAAGRDKEAVYRLFGKKYDSLPHLLDRVLDHEKASDPVTRYVIVLCARQLLLTVLKEFPEFVTENGPSMKELDTRLRDAGVLREELVFADGTDRDGFLDWFERWFLARAEPMEVTA